MMSLNQQIKMRLALAGGRRLGEVGSPFHDMYMYQMVVDVSASAMQGSG